MENKMEGGPACDYFWHNKAGKDVVCLEVDRKENHRNDCPGCKGTGVKPLSEWTDAQKAEWLKKYMPADRKFKGIVPHELRIFTNGRYNTMWFIKYKHSISEEMVLLAQGLNFSAALTAAVEAVAKESNEK